MKTIGKLILFVLVFLAFTANIYAQTPAEQFKQMVAQLQTTPTDNALREKIIKLGAEMNPPPVVPDEAVRYEGRGQFAFKNAKSETLQSDYASAAQEYEKAVIAAPWVAGYYSDLCTIYEKTGKYGDAKRNCQFYMAALSDPKDITEVKRRIAGLEYGMENAAKPPPAPPPIPDRLSGTWTQWDDESSMPAPCSATKRLVDYRTTYKEQGRYEMQLNRYCERSLTPGIHPATFVFTLNGNAMQGAFSSDGTDSRSGSPVCDPIASNLTGSLSADGVFIEFRYSDRSQADGQGCRLVDRKTKFKRLN